MNFSQEKQKPMNLYHLNLEAELGYRPDIALSNTRIDLNVYAQFLNNVQQLVEKAQSIAIDLRREESDPKDKDQEKQSEYIYSLVTKGNKSKQQEIIQQQLFNWEISYLYPDQAKKRERQIQIIRREEDSQRLILDTDLGTEATVYILQDSYTIKKQKEAVVRLRDKPLLSHRPLLKLFQGERFEKLREYDWDMYNHPITWKVLKDHNRDGVDEQRDFVRKALATADFALLEGPPGSGKTTTIIELIIQLCKQGKRVLLVSSTHVAVDNVLKRILTDYRASCEEWVAPVRIARDEGSIRYDEVKEYHLPNLVETKRKAMRSHLQAMPHRRPSQQMLLDSLQKNPDYKALEEAILESSNLVCGTSIGILQHPLIKNGANIDAPFDVMIVDEASKVTFQEFLVPALYARRWVLVGDVQQLSPYVEDEWVEMTLSGLLQPEEKQQLEILFPVWKSWRRSKNMQIVLVEKGVSLDFSFFETDNIINLNELRNHPIDIARLNAADIIWGENNAKNRAFLDQYIYVKAQVHGGDLQDHFAKTQAFYKNKNFHTEKPARWESELAHRLSQYYAYRSAPELGEHFKEEIDFLAQLGGEDLKERLEQVRRIMMPSILELLQKGIGRPEKYAEKERILYDGIPDEAKELKFVSLQYQHRMEDLLASTSRKHFYQNENLKTSQHTKDRANILASYKAAEGPIVWVSQTQKRGANDYENEEEANSICSEIVDFEQWAQTQGTKRNYEIAVLCFYKQQEALVRKKLQKLLYDRIGKQAYRYQKNFPFQSVKVILCTVDKFQGDEADMVLLAFTRASRNAFYKSPNRLNVALTRARYKLVLFGNHTFFKEKEVSEPLTYLAKQFNARLFSETAKSNRS